MDTKQIKLSVCAVGLCAGLAAAGGDPSTDQDFDNDHGYMLIGDPGNRDTNLEEVAGRYTNGQSIGGVDYAFRMARLEMTLAEQIEFIEAYAPIYFKNHPDRTVAQDEFVSPYLVVTRSEIRYFGSIRPQQAGAMGWEYVARYANWLHHGKVNEEWAFETGVYDTARFACDELPCNYQETRNPGARYWIPSLDERTKAGFWDPNKDGVGGYWKYPNGTDHAMLPGFLPENGGQRNSRDRDRNGGVSFPLDVGSYPNETSPWGLLDIAGGEWEWTEHFTGSYLTGSHHRAWLGTAWFLEDYNEPFDEDAADPDRLGLWAGRSLWRALGVRLGRVVDDPADLDSDGRVDFFDISFFVDQFVNGDERVDFRADGVLDADDVRVFLGLLNEASDI